MVMVEGKKMRAKYTREKEKREGGTKVMKEMRKSRERKRGEAPRVLKRRVEGWRKTF